jgi:hypothetical protein
MRYIDGQKNKYSVVDIYIIITLLDRFLIIRSTHKHMASTTETEGSRGSDLPNCVVHSPSEQAEHSDCAKRPNGSVELN